MAKGNDGNLFQHTIELEAAAFLLRTSGARGLYFATTHAMAPDEPLDAGAEAAKAATSSLLLSKLRIAAGVGDDASRHPLVVRAFAALGASPAKYPNSAKLLEWLTKQEGATLSGAIAELEPSKIASLRDHFAGSSVQVLAGSWRQHLEALRPPVDLATPWLFSMDPMKFTSGADADGNKMTTWDFARLTPIWQAYLAQGRPGVVAVFSYSMQRDQREHFLSALVANVLPLLPGCRLGVLEALNYTSDYHVAALLSSSEALLLHERDRLLAVMPVRARDRDSFPVQSNIFEGVGP